MKAFYYITFYYIWALDILYSSVQFMLFIACLNSSLFFFVLDFLIIDNSSLQSLKFQLMCMIGKWSDMSVTNIAWVDFWRSWRLLLNMLSIRVAELFVILVGRFIKGTKE